MTSARTLATTVSSVGLATLAFSPSLVYPHHSRAEFADEILDVSGELVEVAWRNPHPALIVKVTTDDGQEELWRVEGWSSANSLDRIGVTADVFHVGDRVRVAVQASTRREGAYLGRSVLLPNGVEAALRPNAEPFWSDADILTATKSDAAATGAGQGSGLFRVWTFVDRDGGGDPPLTARAEQSLEGFDELRDHPLFRCEPVGMPIAMDSTLPIQFIDNGDIIVMRAEQNDVARTIRMNAESNPAGQPATPLGYSVGRWEDGDLVVTTSRIDYPYFNDDGVPMSEDLELVERFSLSDDGTTLSWRATATDPQNFTAPVEQSATWRWVPGESIKPWECALWPTD
jgi:hypothetical protein